MSNNEHSLSEIDLNTEKICDKNYESERSETFKNRFELHSRTSWWKVSLGVFNAISRIAIGVIIFVNCRYALKTVDIKPLTSTQKHILLCVIGYQLLMAEAILAFNSGNSWAQTLTARNKKLAHWMLQVAGCSLAIAGSILKMVDKPANFTSTHGIIGFVAMLLTGISLLNGITALYAYELRNFTKPKFLKLAHIICGTLAFVLASVCLCYGFVKAKFRAWATPGATTVIIALCGFNTFLVILQPLISGFKKLYL